MNVFRMLLARVHIFVVLCFPPLVAFGGMYSYIFPIALLMLHPMRSDVVISHTLLSYHSHSTPNH